MSSQNTIFTSDESNPTDFRLIETILKKKTGEIPFLPYHLQRLKRSTDILHFIYDEKKVVDSITQMALSSTKDLRIRLEIFRNGTISSSAQELLPLEKNKKWSLQIATIRICSTNPLQKYKTTNRTIFNLARNEFKQEEIDEVILLNERNEVCEGTRTNIFIQKKQSQKILTPILSSALLPGVLRQSMIEREKAEESVLLLNDLLQAQRIFVGNAIYGLQPAFIKT